MIRSTLIFCFGIAASWLLPACGNVKTDAPCQGAETCQCYPNKTCNGTLVCLSNLCVDADPSLGGGSFGGEAGEAGAVESGAGASSAGASGAGVSRAGAANGGDGNESLAGSAGEANGDVPAREPLMWLRADLGVTADSTGLITNWLDESGNGHDGKMDAPEREPTLIPDALNGLPVVRFDGAQSMYITPIAPTSFSVFVVGKNRNPVNEHGLLLGPGGDTPNNQLRWEDDTSVLIVGLGNDLPELTFAFGDTRVFHALSARYDGSLLTIGRNGEEVGSAQFTTLGPWALGQVGGWFSSDFLIGDLAEVLVYDRALSSADTKLTQAYLARKYGL